MSVTLTIVEQMKVLADEHGKTLAPLSDDLALLGVVGLDISLLGHFDYPS